MASTVGPTSVVRDVSLAENLVSLLGFALATGVFIGTVVYGMNRRHPWIGLLAAFGTSGVVSAAFAVGISSAFPVNASEIVVTREGTRLV